MALAGYLTTEFRFILVSPKSCSDGVSFSQTLQCFPPLLPIHNRSGFPRNASFVKMPFGPCTRSIFLLSKGKHTSCLIACSTLAAVYGPTCGAPLPVPAVPQCSSTSSGSSGSCSPRLTSCDSWGSSSTTPRSPPGSATATSSGTPSFSARFAHSLPASAAQLSVTHGGGTVTRAHISPHLPWCVFVCSSIVPDILRGYLLIPISLNSTDMGFGH